MTDSKQDASDRLLEIVAQCIRSYEHEGEAAVEAACDTHPELAERIRARVRALQRMGLLEGDADGPGGVPERLGDFRLIRRLGGGGMGVVYLAEQESLGREVALKLVRPELLFFPGARERFAREVEALAQLEHPGIVPVHAGGEAAGVPYLAMERVRGASLADVVQALSGEVPETLAGEAMARVVAERAGVGEVSPGGRRLFEGGWVRVALRIAREVAEALAHAHGKGIYHRDVKPSNVMVNADGRVLLVDFGLARSEGATAMTVSGSLVGSLPYMAPEQIRGEAIDERTDVYGLGVTLYELLALSSAFGGQTTELLRARILQGRPEPLSGQNPAVPWDVETVCTTAMDPERERRYAGAAAFAADLANCLELRPISARRPGPWLRARRATQRHPALATALAAVLLVLIAGPLLFALQQRAAADRERQDARKLRVALDQRDVQQKRAEQHLGLAKDALARVLTRYGENLQDVPRMGGIHRTMIEDLVRYYEKLSQEEDLEVQHDATRALWNAANIRRRLGEYDKAKQQFRDCIARSQQLLTRTDDPPTQVLLAKAWNSLGITAMATDDRDLAREAWAEAKTVLERVPTPKSQDGLSARRNLAIVTRNLASLGSTEDPMRSDVLMTEVQAAQEAMAREFPEDLDVRSDLAATYHNRGMQLVRRKQDVDGEDLLTRAIETQEQVVEKRPADPDALLMLSRYLETMTMFERVHGNWSEAEEHAHSVVAIRERLVAGFPERLQFRGRLAYGYLVLAQTLLLGGAAAEAMEVAQTAVDECETVHRDAPKVVEYGFQLGSALGLLAELEAGAGRAQEATDLCERACSLLLAAWKQRASGQRRNAARKVWLRLAGLYVAADRLEDAVKLLAAGIEAGFLDAEDLRLGAFRPLRKRDDFRELNRAARQRR